MQPGQASVYNPNLTGFSQHLGALHQFLAGPALRPAAPVDWVIGFGHFDLGIPRLCGALHRQGLARRIAFTGGVGAGTADLGQPEAEAFLAELLRTFPDTAGAEVAIENQSTNTAENLQLLSALLARTCLEQCPDGIPRSALLVATPIRLRRVLLTARRHLPGCALSGLAPARDWKEDHALYQSKGLSLTRQMLGELERLQTYPARGWIEASVIPADVLDHAARLTAALRAGELT